MVPRCSTVTQLSEAEAGSAAKSRLRAAILEFLFMDIEVFTLQIYLYICEPAITNRA